MSHMFEGAVRFNADISRLDTSSVETMAAMFEDAESFNQDISDWDVSGVSGNRKPYNWDSGAGFEDNTSKHPDWEYNI